MTLYGGKVYCDHMDGFCHLHDEPPPITNADHIRSMTDEELAEFLMKLLRQGVDCFAEGVFPYHPCPQDHDCRKCGVDWLKQPYGGE